MQTNVHELVQLFSSLPISFIGHFKGEAKESDSKCEKKLKEITKRIGKNKITKEDHEEIKEQLRILVYEDQENLIPQIKEIFTRADTDEKKSKAAITCLKFIFHNFSELYDKELFIQYFMEIIKQMRTVDENQSRQDAEKCYQICSAAAVYYGRSRIIKYIATGFGGDDLNEDLAKNKFFQELAQISLEYDKEKLATALELKWLALAERGSKAIRESSCQLI